METENKKNGWISIFRSLKNKGYYNNSYYVHLWIHLLLSVNHEQSEFFWNGKLIKLQAGQFITGRKKLSDETGISQTTIERILKCFENEHQIGQQKTTKYRLITILKWKQYQDTDSKTDSKRTTDGQQADTNNNNNNNNKDNKNTGGTPPPTKFQKPNIEEISNYCKERKNNVNPSKFIDFYESKGWMVGKNKMKDWKACVRTWENSSFDKKDSLKVDTGKYTNIKKITIQQ